MKHVAVMALGLALSLPAAAQERRPWPNYLIELQAKANELCRGVSGDNPQSEALCQVRDDLTRRLRAQGLCYGERGQIGAEMRWHWCNANSGQPR